MRGTTEEHQIGRKLTKNAKEEEECMKTKEVKGFRSVR